MYGCTFPGRMISSAGDVCFGETTDTAGRAIRAVCASRVVRALTRDQMPDISRPAMTNRAIAQPIHRLGERFAVPTSFNVGACSLVGFGSSVLGSINDSITNAHFQSPPDSDASLVER